MAALEIGTSGWIYKHWRGVFYPPALPSAQHLAFYAQHLSTVEVNFSFYRLPEREVFEGWRNQTPPGFLFAVKGSRYLTHMKKLREPEEPLERLMHRASGLQEKLGPILFQFPRTWRQNPDRLGAFLRALRPYSGCRFAFEFRHESWLTPEVYRMLEAVDAALCLPVGPGVPLDVRSTAGWTYVRMHHGALDVAYGEDELSAWARRVDEFLSRGVDIYVYFNNDHAGHALRDADRLRRMLDYGAPAAATAAGASALASTSSASSTGANSSSCRSSFGTSSRSRSFRRGMRIVFTPAR
jgi:uncharacterized protein YecE (DUF72 family)